MLFVVQRGRWPRSGDNPIRRRGQRSPRRFCFEGGKARRSVTMPRAGDAAPAVVPRRRFAYEEAPPTAAAIARIMMSEADPAPQDRHRLRPDHRQRDPVRAHPGRQPGVSRARASTRSASGCARRGSFRTMPATIVATVNEVRRKFDYVFTTGGIGPTHDDITAQCIADAFGVPLIVHPEAKRLLESHYPPGASQRGAAAHGDGAGRRGAAAQPDLARARLPDRQRLCAAGRAADHAGDLQRAEAPAARRRQDAEPQRQLHSRRRHHRQGSGGACRSAIPISRSAPTRISGAAISA